MTQAVTPTLKRTALPLLVGRFAIICLTIDFLPRHGPPNYRYAGSDPTRLVWNFGWPIAQFVNDPLSGLHAGPLARQLLPLQAGFFAALSLYTLTTSRQLAARH